MRKAALAAERVYRYAHSDVFMLLTMRVLDSRISAICVAMVLVRLASLAVLQFARTELYSIAKVRRRNMGKKIFDYLIIGDSAAGVNAAEQIRQNNQQASIMMLSKEPYPAYGRPLISYMIEKKIDEDCIWYRSPSFYENHNIEVLRGAEYEAVSLDANAHTVVLKNGECIQYGKCLIATGSISTTPPIKNLENAKNVFPFMTLDHAKDLLNAARVATDSSHREGKLSTAVIIGAGLIGLKAAEALVGHVDEVIVVSRRWILPQVLDPDAGAVLQKSLEEAGIQCLTGAAAKDLTLVDNRIHEVALDDGTTIACDVLVSALGVRPNSALAVHAGAAEERGLICGNDLQTSLCDVYAAGDVTQVNNLLDGTHSTLALWRSAVRQGKAAGAFMCGAACEPYTGDYAVNATYFFDFPLLSAGITNPGEGSGYEVDVRIEKDCYAKFVTKDDKLKGYILLNKPENAGIYTSLIEQQIPLSSLPKDVFDRAPSNLDFPSADRWNRIHEAYPNKNESPDQRSVCNV
jgi:nitrite reductase (NADH) large subunit